MALSNNIDQHEIEKFEGIAQKWWDPHGEMGTLHTINPLRTGFILERNTLVNPYILDLGCGGGILAEALAKSGARVVGVDASQSSIQAAQLHARQQGLEIDYYYEDAEAFARSHAGLFDIVTCMEMLEHVPKPANIIAASSQALKAGGVSFFSSINRTLKAFLFAVLIGEYILHLLPKGTHQYHKLICPQELRQWGEGNGLDFVRISSLMYNPLTRRFKLVADKQDVNYLMHFVKKENPDWKASAH